mgnify:CR=1 FL=1
MEQHFNTPAEVIDNNMKAGEGKAHLPLGKMILLGIMAGAFIALGGATSSTAAHAIDNVGLARFVAGIIFPVGLMIIVFVGGELFTGNCLMVMALLERRITPAQLLRNWLTVYLGNAVGGAAVARAHMNEVKRRLKEEKNAKDEDVLVSLQLVNEMLVRGYEFLPIELGKSRGSKYVVEDGKVRLPFCSLKGLGGAAADALENVTIHGEEYLSIEELQQASGVGSSIIDRLRQVGALGELPESSQVSFF